MLDASIFVELMFLVNMGKNVRMCHGSEVISAQGRMAGAMLIPVSFDMALGVVFAIAYARAAPGSDDPANSSGPSPNSR